MFSNRAPALAVGFMVLPQIGDAAEGAARCVDASAAKRTSDAHHGKWIELTSDQWQLLRGIYAINPLTPRGLPNGDNAALIKIDGRPGSMVFLSTATKPARRSGSQRASLDHGRRGDRQDQPRRKRALTVTPNAGRRTK